jgi:peroxiredoxin
VILAFYPADWSPFCGDQMLLYNEMLPEFRRLKAQLIGLWVDGVCVKLRLLETANYISAAHRL